MYVDHQGTGYHIGRTSVCDVLEPKALVHLSRCGVVVPSFDFGH